MESKPKATKFLALDKCLPRRQYMQILNLPANGPLKLEYDPEWLTVLRLTNHLSTSGSQFLYMPGPGSKERYYKCIRINVS